jgi:hypothetical protein
MVERMICRRKHKGFQIALARNAGYWYTDADIGESRKTGKRITTYFLCPNCGKVYVKIFSYHKNDGYETYTLPEEYHGVLHQINYWERCKYNTKISKESRDAIKILCPQYREILTNLIKGEQITIETFFEGSANEKRRLRRP